MANRTFAIGDIHGGLEELVTVLDKFPPADAHDTLVLLGDYLDRGPKSAEVIRYIRADLKRRFPGKLVVLRGNHEDGWLRVASGGWPHFVLPPSNGCLATLRSFEGRVVDGEMPSFDEIKRMREASFLPPDVIDWMNSLPHWYEDEHAIYVHAGLIEAQGQWLHPRDTPNPAVLLWVRTMRFFEAYDGKRCVCGHTTTDNLPPELSTFTPEDPLDMWVNGSVVVIDTGCGTGGFLTGLELPAMKVYESR